MNLSKPEAESAAIALGRLEAWLDTMRGDGGYYGPVVGLRGTAMSWCGPGHDWRWEGLLDGWITLHSLTRNPVYLDRIEHALSDLHKAQLANGTFRNSYFENNPFEGGMPYEPATMAAVLRAGRCLDEQGRGVPDGTAVMIERFVEQRLIKELWNKVLRTFNNWMQSDFEIYSPPAVASILEMLCDYAELTDTASRWTPYIAGAAESLLKSQVANGPLRGALPVSNREGASASPFLSARCLTALARIHQFTGDARFAAAGDMLADFVRTSLLPEGGIPFMVYANRPTRTTPLFVGAAAGTLMALDRVKLLDPSVASTQLKWILGRQTASGAFDTAVGFGSGSLHPRRPDWRDVLPVCGWSDKVYAFLARLAMGPVQPGKSDSVHRSVLVQGHLAEFAEDSATMSVRSGKTNWFVWTKRTVWPNECR
ncbi:MAG: hypothetical protein WCP86_02565, partial [bacterium]